MFRRLFWPRVVLQLLIPAFLPKNYNFRSRWRHLAVVKKMRMAKNQSIIFARSDEESSPQKHYQRSFVVKEYKRSLSKHFIFLFRSYKEFYFQKMQALSNPIIFSINSILYMLSIHRLQICTTLELYSLAGYKMQFGLFGFC